MLDWSSSGGQRGGHARGTSCEVREVHGCWSCTHRPVAGVLLRATPHAAERHRANLVGSDARPPPAQGRGRSPVVCDEEGQHPHVSMQPEHTLHAAQDREVGRTHAQHTSTAHCMLAQDHAAGHPCARLIHDTHRRCACREYTHKHTSTSDALMCIFTCAAGRMHMRCWVHCLCVGWLPVPNVCWLPQQSCTNEKNAGTAQHVLEPQPRVGIMRTGGAVRTSLSSLCITRSHIWPMSRRDAATAATLSLTALSCRKCKCSALRAFSCCTRTAMSDTAKHVAAATWCALAFCSHFFASARSMSVTRCCSSSRRRTNAAFAFRNASSSSSSSTSSNACSSVFETMTSTRGADSRSKTNRLASSSTCKQHYSQRRAITGNLAFRACTRLR